MDDLISRLAAIERIRMQMDRPDSVGQWAHNDKIAKVCYEIVIEALERLPSAGQEIVRCKDCKYWERQTYQGAPLSWGHCESEIMWNSLYGERYEEANIDTNEDHFCGYAARRIDA